MPTAETMRCKHCRYRLDGLTDNRCPECGEAFDPNDSTTFDGGPKQPRENLLALVLGFSVPATIVMFIAIAIIVESQLPDFMPFVAFTIPCAFFIGLPLAVLFGVLIRASE